MKQRINYLHTNLTKHFTLEEMTCSQTARQLGIDNTPKPWQIDNMRTLCKNVLEPLREHVGHVVITSGFRCPTLNKAVGGKITSQHIKGQAADIHISDASHGQAIFEWIKDNTTFDQLIYEVNSKNGSSWIHVSAVKERSQNRKQVIDMRK